MESQTFDLWFDCDPGHDDMMALLLALGSKRVNLLGISTTAGNANVTNTTNNALKTLYIAGAHTVPVVEGSSESLTRGSRDTVPVFGAEGLDGAVINHNLKKLDANPFVYMRETIIKNPRKVVFFATGPLTNVALLFRVFPEVKKNIERVIIMGGSTIKGNVTPAAEYNIWCDPEAAHVVLQCGLPMIMMPLDVTNGIYFTEAIRKKLNLTSKFGETLLGLLEYFRIKELEFDPALPGGRVHDAATVAYLLQPELFEVKRCHMEIEMASSTDAGKTIVVYEDALPAGKTCNCSIALGLDYDKFWDLMIGALHIIDKQSPLNQK